MLAVSISFYHRVRRVTQRKVRTVNTFLYVLFLGVSLCLCSLSSYASETITVAVASSFYSQAQHISEQFEATHDVKVRLVSGATGRLYNQIQQGAPFDIWIAAETERPALLSAKHKYIDEAYLGVQVGKKLRNLKALQKNNIKHIAIANPDAAPFGLAAKAMLESQGLWQLLKPKLVYAQNAMQAAMMVNQGLTDAGFVPIADKTHALATVPYVAVLLSDKPNAQLFYQVLGSEVSTSPSKQSYSATEVAHPSGSEAQGEGVSLRKHPGVLASPNL